MQKAESGARVVRICGVGEEALRGAIESGMISAQARREIEGTLARNAQLEEALCAKQSRITVMEAERRERRRIEIEARALWHERREERREARRTRAFRCGMVLAFGFGLGFTAMSLIATYLFAA